MAVSAARQKMMDHLAKGTEEQLTYAFRTLCNTAHDRPLWDYEQLTLDLVGAELERRRAVPGWVNPFSVD